MRLTHHLRLLAFSRIANLTQRKEVNLMMTYSKPELTFLGSATDVIQGVKVLPQSIDGAKTEHTPAYDPDEG
jgi:hypothetical protein